MPLPPVPARVNRPKTGILLILASTLLFSILWVFVKQLAERYPVYEVSFFRNFFALLPVAMLAAPPRNWRKLRVRRLGGHLWRAVIGVTGMVLGFTSYHLMPLANAVAISFMSPLVVTALSAPMLGEAVGLHRWSAVIFGFAGVLVIVHPGAGMFGPGVAVAIAAAVANAVSAVTIRQLNRIDQPLAIVLWFTLFSTLLTALPLPFLWVTPAGADWLLMLAMGLTGGFGQYCMTRAFSLAPAAVVSPFNYSGLLWATLWGMAIWGDVPSPRVLIGALVVIASGLYLLYRETRPAGR